MKTVFLCLSLLMVKAFSAAPSLQHANLYHDDIVLQDYWVSEKYDGVRAYWNGSQLVSRQGNIINAPDWFTKPLPTQPLDGELWLARGKFDRLSGVVRHKVADDRDWRLVKYMVFDLPASEAIFDERLRLLDRLIDAIDQPHVQLVKQQKIANQAVLMQTLEEVVAGGGEGLMLHRGSSTYKQFRTSDLLKLKKHDDAEAVVLKHLPGKGKYQGMMGSILVETANGKRFKIGSGFSDQERRNPPATGSIITYQFFGLTNKGIPRFASFLRIRNDH